MQIILVIILLGCYFLFFNREIKETVSICLITLVAAGTLGIIFGAAKSSAMEIAIVLGLLFLLRQAYKEI
ncbi:MAG: hypothetical protein LBS33_02420 [Streptococcaceae bacterium]|jgi:hypothetical protein|nr:hypothetical protein [Streptococcaceae bacterium]